jgi:hypothetical protein
MEGIIPSRTFSHCASHATVRNSGVRSATRCFSINPFRIGPDGTRDEVIEKYKEWIVRGDGRHLLRNLGELEGRTLGCFCAPKGGVTEHDPLVCHGQVLLKLLEHRRRKIRQKLRDNRG